MIITCSARSGYLGLVGVAFCIAVALATARWSGWKSPDSPQAAAEPATAAAPSKALTDGGIAGPTSDESRLPAREEGKRVADSQDPDVNWDVAPLHQGDETRTGVEPESAHGFEDRELNAHEITLQDIDWFGQHVVEPDAGERRAQLEELHERQRSALDGTEELAGVCAGVSDGTCDSRLYHSGEPNRVYLPKVLDDSPAFEFGLRAGDEIIRVGEERIFSVFDLRDALANRSEGPPIIIDALRDGTPMQFSIPAGARLGTPYGAKTAAPLLE